MMAHEVEPFFPMNKLLQGLYKAVLNGATDTAIGQLHPFLHKRTTFTLIDHRPLYSYLLSKLIQYHGNLLSMLRIQDVIN